MPANFFGKGADRTYFRLCGPTVSAAITELYYSTKAATDDTKMKVRLNFNKPLFINTERGPDLVHGPQFVGLYIRKSLISLVTP